MCRFSKYCHCKIQWFSFKNLHSSLGQKYNKKHPSKMQVLLSCLHLYDNFYFQIKSMGATVNYSQHEMYAGIFVKVQMFTSALFLAFSAYSCRNFIGFLFISGFVLSYVAVTTVFGALLGLFTFLLLNVKLRFKKLNENLWLVIFMIIIIVSWTVFNVKKYGGIATRHCTIMMELC